MNEKGNNCVIITEKLGGKHMTVKEAENYYNNLALAVFTQAFLGERASGYKVDSVDWRKGQATLKQAKDRD